MHPGSNACPIMPPQARLRDVHITSGFWVNRIDAVRTGTLPHIYKELRETGRWDCLKLNWKPGDPKKPHRFWDSDIAKWLEAACYSLTLQPDPQLAGQVEEAVNLIRGAQQSDGYLNSYYTVVEPGKRWTNIAWSHEMYCAGHLLEAALAHYHYTHSTRLLNPILKYVSHIRSVFGPKEGKKHGYPGHQCLELALLKAYEETSGPALLQLADYFIEERGKTPHYYDIEADARGEEPFVGPMRKSGKRYEYHQADMPVREIQSVQGHSVRAMYWLTAVANLARLKNDATLLTAARRLWESTTKKKMYITGGLGAIGEWEGFGPDYFLPNETGYLETCAAIGLVFFARQMLLIDPANAEYAEVMERALYNGVLVGLELDGKSFFYDNPLATIEGNVQRSEWFEVACCPPNVARLLSSLGKYIYTLGPDDTVYVHLYISSIIQMRLSSGNLVRITQETNDPWVGGSKITIEGKGRHEVKVGLRTPKGAIGLKAYVNDCLVPEPIGHSNTFILDCSKHPLRPTSTLSLDFAYRPSIVRPHYLDSINRGHVAITRGPLVYCVETIDNPNVLDLRSIRLPENPAFEQVMDKDRFSKWGMQCVILKAKAMVKGDSGKRETDIMMVPYFLWANRGKSDLRVWLAT